MATYRYSGSSQIVTVSQTGEYDIVAYGAQGGQDGPEAGGRGAEIGSQFQLTAGTKLKLVVGGTGTDLGGGGGTFVLAKYAGSSSYVPLVIAGGGGGATQNSAGGDALVAKGPGTRTGLGGYAGDAPSGSDGAGGGGGAGLFGAGGSSYYGSKRQAEGGHNGAGGYLGGQNTAPPKNASIPDQGGFGGGGAGSQEGSGGGGGGYTGGTGGYNNFDKRVFGAGQGGGSYSAIRTLSQYTAAGENLGNGKVVISPSVTCYVSGTMILTSRGDCAVEDLAAGDIAVTASGAHRPIRWVGHRTINCDRHPRPAEVMPVRIAAHAFGPNKPARDLYVSPGHAICIDMLGGVLIPAGSLVNGSTIVQVDVESVIYWHVELDEHEIILAEGLPAESYLEMGNRDFFAENGTVALAASPDTTERTHADFCRQYYAVGSLVEAARARLNARAAALEWGQDREAAAA